MTDNVNHPSHYAEGWSNGAEVIDITENLNFNRGNAVKYISRAGKKDPAKELEDLLKAEFYLQREIVRLTPGSSERDFSPKPRVWEDILEIPHGTIVNPARNSDWIYITDAGRGWFIGPGELAEPETNGWQLQDSDNRYGPFTEVIA